MIVNSCKQLRFFCSLVCYSKVISVCKKFAKIIDFCITQNNCDYLFDNLINSGRIGKCCNHHDASSFCQERPYNWQLITASDCWSIIYIGSDKQLTRQMQHTRRQPRANHYISIQVFGGMCMSRSRGSIFHRKERVLAGLHTEKASTLLKSVFPFWNHEMTNWIIANRTAAFTQDAQFSVHGVALDKNSASIDELTFFSSCNYWIFFLHLTVEAMDTSGIPQWRQHYQSIHTACQT